MTDPLHTEPVDLLPCPFCGHAPFARQIINDGRWAIDCQTANCVRPGTDLTRDKRKAIAAWNTRTAAEAASRQEVERLREALERLREALAETREMLGLCEQIICDETCPTTWRTADGQPHGQMHKDICDVLARHEHHIHPARSALTASEAPDA